MSAIQSKLSLSEELRAAFSGPGRDPAHYALELRAASALERMEAMEKALRDLIPLARGWCGVLGRQYGHGHPKAAEADAAVHRARSALAALEVA